MQKSKALKKGEMVNKMLREIVDNVVELSKVTGLPESYFNVLCDYCFAHEAYGEPISTEETKFLEKLRNFVMDISDPDTSKLTNTILKNIDKVLGDLARTATPSRA